MNKPITIIVQVTSECNLACDYCYVRKSGINHHSMSEVDVTTLIQNCIDGYDSVEFCWHGGEPLLVGFEFYKKIVNIQNTITSENNVKIRNTIQTNSTLLNHDIIDFFKNNGFGIGTSFDAPPETNDQTRKFENNTNSTNSILKSAKLLMKSGLKFQPLCVVTDKNIEKAEEIFNFFKAQGASSYSLLIEMSKSSHQSGVTSEKIFNLYKKTFELWLSDDNSFESIQPIDTIVKSLIGDRPTMCSYTGSCLEKMISIHPNGDVVQCGSFVDKSFVLGNIFDEKMIKILNNEKCLEFKRIRQETILNHCKNCEYVSVCNGGCREATYVASGSYTEKYPQCDARKLTFDYIRTRLETIIANASS